jgi:class 3 adenylate cyclase
VATGATLTFLFTDIEGSTRLWERHRDVMGATLTRHDALIERLVAQHGGQVVRPRGEGDSRFAVFPRAKAAVSAAAEIALALQTESWPTRESLPVRLALHTGEADLRDGDYYGSAVNRCARLRAIAHGGQVLLSGTTAALVRDQLPDGLSLRGLGMHALQDLLEPEAVFQLLHPCLPADFPPLRTLGEHPHNLAPQRSSMIGRERELAETIGLLLREDVGPRHVGRAGWFWQDPPRSGGCESAVARV